MFFGRFLVASLGIPNRRETEFIAFDSYDDRGNPTEEINNILRNKLYDVIRVGVIMLIDFLLFSSLDTLTEYEAEQLEDLHDEGDDSDEGYEENLTTALAFETPFVSEECTICLTAKPNIIFFPCLHQAVCHECDGTGKLFKCSVCRVKINRKIKI